MCLSLLVFLGCEKQQKNQSVTYVQINEDMKKAFYYKPGTYWIYKDSLTGTIDSFSVVSSFLDSSAVWPGIKGGGQSYNIVININEYALISGKSLVSTWKWELVRNAVYSNLYADEGGVDYYTPFISYPLADSGKYESGPYRHHYDTDTFFTYTISGMEYRVTQIHEYDNTLSYDNWLYISEEIGIIKMRAKCLDSVYHIWELERYHIEK